MKLIIVLIIFITANALAQTCLDDISPLDISCAASDVSSIIGVRRINGETFCARNEPIEVKMEVEVMTTATTRYDIGIWIANDGGDALTGDCDVFTLYPASTTNLDLDLTGGYGPYRNWELAEPADTCGELRKTDVPSVTRLEDQYVTVLCSSDSMISNASLATYVCLTWNNQARTGMPCTNGNDTIPSQSSKCNCQSYEFGNITVADPPTAIDDEIGTIPNVTECASVLDNDLMGSPNGAPFNVSTLVICGQPDPLAGTVEVVGDEICFTPHPQAVDVNSTFCYTICSDHYDGTNPLFCSNATNNIVSVGPTIMCQDDFAIGVYENITFVNVTANDTPANGGSGAIDHSKTMVPTDPECGTYLGTTPEGLLKLTHEEEFDGNCTFTYKVCTLGCVCTYCNVTVEFQRPPEAIDDIDVTNVNVPVTTDVLVNDLGFTYPIDPSSVTITGSPTTGTITNINTITGEIEYTPPLDFYGIVTYDYTVCDTASPTPLCDEAQVTITINEPPTCQDILGEHVVVNDTLVVDVSQGFTPGTIGGGEINETSVTVVDGPYFGNIDSITGTNVTYTPNVNYEGKDNFTVIILQTDGQNCSLTVFIDIHLPPMCMDDLVTLLVNTSGAQIDVIANDFDGSSHIDPSTVTIITPPVNGTIDSINGTTGIITYTPTPTHVGPDTFVYQVCDYNMLCCQSTVFINMVVGPTANNITIDVKGGDVVIIHLTGNDVAGTNPLDENSCMILTHPDVGTASLLPFCSASYTSVQGDVGLRTIEYKVCDTSPSPQGPFCDTAWVNINVLLGPTAVNDTSVTTQNVPVVIDVLENDLEGGASLDPSTVTITENPLGGIIVSINATTGEIEYQPNSTFCGMDSFKYSVEDTNGCGDEAIVEIMVHCPPVANDDGAMPMQGVEECIDVLINDVPGTTPINASTVMICVPPTNGTVQVMPNGEICYTSDAEFSSPPNDDFTYKVQDEYGLFSNCANVMIIVIEPMENMTTIEIETTTTIPPTVTTTTEPMVETTTLPPTVTTTSEPMVETTTLPPTVTTTTEEVETTTLPPTVITTTTTEEVETTTLPPTVTTTTGEVETTTPFTNGGGSPKWIYIFTGTLLGVVALLAMLLCCCVTPVPECRYFDPYDKNAGYTTYVTEQQPDKHLFKNYNITVHGTGNKHKVL
jgi:hypothetical protein